MKIVRRLSRRVVLLVLLGIVVASVGAGIALARGTATPIGTGVVVIDTNLAYQGGGAAGTGMVLTSSGEVLTNNHVISGATTIKVVIPKTGHSYGARVVGYDRTADIAVLQLRGASNLRTVSTSSAKLTVGATVTAFGNAGGTGNISSATGTVTGLGRSITASDETGGSEQLTGLIETNAGLQPGDSGGPLVDNRGQVVGVDTAASTGFGFQDVSARDAYAVPIAKALTIAHAISSGSASATVHIGATPFLGIEVGSVAAAGYGGQSVSGALIAGMVSGGPAASAGLVPGDVITAIDGHAVSSPAAISGLVLERKPGAKLRVAYVDQFGTSHATSVTLGSGPAQ
ncbi:MAG TPA: trypsin-like peptidase domain-containing protein [Gaiellaceae bacterium]|nr:trypsin-like peptidase domain-containing protein [Gaiellaceae bacterium]